MTVLIKNQLKIVDKSTSKKTYVQRKTYETIVIGREILIKTLIENYVLLKLNERNT